ncbi:DUF3027 domain-containing protein [Microbacterium marmarense]|uniref:DUF3027 domain-containing protein n=1 Tax=Microbacterium marmarense TaxID=3122051 RepID=A0ABU8LTM1_9MICO
MNLTPESEPTPAEPIEPDQALLTAHDLAIAALSEITAASTIGEPADYRVEADGVVSLRFHNRMPGYPGWLWTVSLARVEGAEPTVLEVELLPSDGALVAPEWVPWAVRLAEYHAAQEALAEEAPTGDDADGLDESEDSDLDDDLDDLDAADFDNDGSPILHAGDLDGVDIDELDEDAVDAEDEDSDDESADDESDEDDSDEDDSESDDDEDDESDDDDSDDEDSDDEDDESDDDDSDDDSESDEDEDEDESDEDEDEDEDESESDSEDDSASDDNEEVASASDED